MYLQSGNVFVKGACVAFNLKPLRWLSTLFSNFQDLDYYNHSLSVQIKVALNFTYRSFLNFAKSCILSC